MTQTLNPQPTVAMVVPSPPTGHVLYVLPMQTVEEARDEFGGTLADALRFVDSVMCIECATEASETRATAAFELSCQSCGIAGCRCVLTEDPHCTDVFFCRECQPVCGGTCCTD
jgi:hypothetical protein